MVARAIDKQLAKKVGICQHPSLAGGRNAVAGALQPHSVCNLLPQPAWLSGLTCKKRTNGGCQTRGADSQTAIKNIFPHSRLTHKKVAG